METLTTEMIQNNFAEDEMQLDYIYTNSRFGYSVLIPASFSKDERDPDNGDGAWFYNKDGAKLTATGYYNVMSDTPESIVEGYPEASYTYVGNTYCCVSYINGTDIVYKAYHVDSDLIYGYEIIYPQEDKDSYDNVINDMLHYLVDN